MAVTNFIPEIWSAQLQSSLKKSLVFAGPQAVNRSYEGEIVNQGDTVHIVSVARPTIAAYAKNVTVIAPEVLTDADRTLEINQANYFAFEIDDVDARQAKSGGTLMSEAASEAAYGLAEAADLVVAALYTGVDAANKIATTSITTAALAVTGLVDLKVKLDVANVPQQSRYVIIPPWYHGLLLQSDTFVRVDASGTSEALRNGFVGRAFGFDVLLSNNVTMAPATDYLVCAGYTGAITFAEQINMVEAYRPQSSFSDAIKGLHLFGAKLVRPSGAATLLASID